MRAACPPSKPTESPRPPVPSPPSAFPRGDSRDAGEQRTAVVQQRFCRSRTRGGDGRSAGWVGLGGVMGSSGIPLASMVERAGVGLRQTSAGAPECLSRNPGGPMTSPAVTRPASLPADCDRERGVKDWYKDAVFYEVHVKAFFDADGNGIGDFAGLTAKLDYVRELGVTCLWILPMYPSPLKDDGYDIADFYGIHPAYGNVEDFQRVPRRRARARAARHRRPRDEPHLRPAPVVPGRARRPRPRPSATTTCGATPTGATGTRASSSPTPRSPTGRGIPSPSSTTGTASSATSPT